MRLPRRSALATGVLAVALLASAPPYAHGDSPPPTDRTFSARLFHPALGPDEFLTVEPAWTLPHLNFSAGLWFDYARGAFSIYKVDGATGTIGDSRAALIRDLIGADAVVALGLFDRLQIGLGLPVALYQAGEDFAYSYGGAPQPAVRAPSGFALGDPWVSAKARLVRLPVGFELGVALAVGLPASLANADSFGGESSVTVGGDLLAGWEADRFRFGLDVGATWRAHDSRFFSTTVGSDLRYAAAFAYDLRARHLLALTAELRGHTLLDGHAITDLAGNPLELDGGIKARVLRFVTLTVGAGAGLVRGVGSPAFRVFAGLTFAPDRRDRDGDGIPDIDDKCPDVPEDKDGFQDDDGCPDLDNDGDTIPDSRDKCPNEPEDFDGFQDDDGCPDPDNDGDGIPDIKDACPFNKEDGLPPRPADGCPRDMTDTDGDGIPDYLDKCPTVAEDKDGFQDDDGCPDRDNDNDGYPDEADQCPNEPEDFDGFEDEDGCPDPDNDQDGILDADDKCPDQPETINGFQDEDGCPDKGPPPKVELLGDEIQLLDKIAFDPNGTTLPASASNMLSQLALTLRAHGELKKVRIEGHVEVLGSPQKEHDIAEARARAVRDFLVGKGVSATRLVVEGVGALRPLADNKTPRGREANRRIELHVVERGPTRKQQQEQQKQQQQQPPPKQEQDDKESK